MYGLTPRQQAELTMEAERRVRAGEPQADVALALGIPRSTLADWARRGGWRRKDLVAVRDAQRGEMVLELIEQMTAKEREKSKAEAAKLREALDASKADLETFVQASSPSAVMGEGPVPAHKLAMAMADSLLRQGQLEEADRAVRLAARFAEAEQAAGAREEAKWKEERERTMKLWAEKQGAYHKLHMATEHVLEQIVATLEQDARRSAEECCPKCGRRMDFWPEEIERPDDDDSAESGCGEFCASGSESAESESGEFHAGEFPNPDRDET